MTSVIPPPAKSPDGVMPSSKKLAMSFSVQATSPFGVWPSPAGVMFGTHPSPSGDGPPANR